MGRQALWTFSRQHEQAQRGSDVLKRKDFLSGSYLKSCNFSQSAEKASAKRILSLQIA